MSKLQSLETSRLSPDFIPRLADKTNINCRNCLASTLPANCRGVRIAFNNLKFAQTAAANHEYMAFTSFRKRDENSRDFYVYLNTVCEHKASQETEILKHFVSDMMHRASPNSQRRANTLLKLAPRIETENKKYIKERMYRKLATEAENAVFGKPYSPALDDTTEK